MKTRIVYTKRDKTILEESHLHEQKAYLKHTYINDVLKKTEQFYFQTIHSVKVYLTDEETPDEDILMEHVLAGGVKIIRTKNHREGQFVHERRYKSFELDIENFSVYDQQDRVVASYSIYDANGNVFLKKFFYLNNGDSREFKYFEDGRPYLKKQEILQSLMEASEMNSVDPSWNLYLQFYPFPFSDESLEIETVRYFSTDYEDQEMTLREAFFKRNFDKKVYRDQKLTHIEHFENLQRIKKTYFIYDDTSFEPKEGDFSIEVEVQYVKEKRNGFTQWESDLYRKNILCEKKIWVTDVLEKKIFAQYIDVTTGKTVAFEKDAYYYDSGYSNLEDFRYKEDGQLDPDCRIVYDDWDGESYTVEEMYENGFFNSEYGKYFLSALPEIPEISDPVKIHETIYKNHLDEVISKKDTQSLYEYSEEIYQNGNLVKRKTYKAHSKEDLRKRKYFAITASYHDHIQDSSDLEKSPNYDEEIYYNKRRINNYMVYDFIIRNDWTMKAAELSGTVVYDNYYRVVSRITCDRLSKKLIEAFKVIYMQVSPLLGQNFVRVNFNKEGDVESYMDSRYDIPHTNSKEKFMANNSGRNPFFMNYYRNLDSLVPENPAFPFMNFTSRKLKFGDEIASESEMTVLRGDSGVTIAVNKFDTYYFLGANQSLNDYLRIFPDGFFNIFFHNIKKEKHTVESDFFGYGITAHFSIDLEDKEINCQFHDGHGDHITFRKTTSNEKTDIYGFFKDERRIPFNFYSEMLAELLLKA
ncbi:hypothetical protein [Chryseobacterium herbae]|uniref:DKNYY family protein n=1 Tax=Chryseobacterium herbae TaxID=2976476 RepID=A0ABT2IRI2_9FLAO|nr:hypothetical protein [Chryseobacterium sp. pc1-10]MCT2561327.1 hypothetical protein [Chryseobacterium sp. pc1-10]